MDVALLNIISYPLDMALSRMNNILIRRAQNGGIFSTSEEFFVNILNIAKVVVDKMILCLEFSELNEKRRKNELSKCDIFLFLCNLFLTVKSVIDFKFASKIILEAQKEHLKNIVNSRKNNRAAKIFSKLVKDNTANMSPEDFSKTIRIINIMNYLEKHFKPVSLSLKKSIEKGVKYFSLH